MVLWHACVKIMRITEGSGPPVSPHGVPCGPSVRFVQEMRGFVCSMGHPEGAYVIKVNVLYRICMVLHAPGDTLGGPMWPKCTFCTGNAWLCMLQGRK